MFGTKVVPAVKNVAGNVAKTYIYNPETKKILPQSIINREVPPMFLTDTSGKKVMNPDFQNDILNTAIMMSGGINFTNKPGQFIRTATGQWGGSVGAKNLVPYKMAPLPPELLEAPIQRLPSEVFRLLHSRAKRVENQFRPTPDLSGLDVNIGIKNAIDAALKRVKLVKGRNVR